MDPIRALGAALCYLGLLGWLIFPAVLLWARRTVAKTRREREAVMLEARLSARRLVSQALQDAIRLGDRKVGAVRMR